MTAPSTSSTNDVNTAIPAYEVSTASPNINVASPQVITASFSDNVVYAFMIENPNGSNLLQQVLEQIHEDYQEAMDLKWQLSLLSMRAKRECRAPRNKEGQFRNQDNTRKQGNNEDTSSKEMLAIMVWFDLEQHLIKRFTTAKTLITCRKNEVLFSEEVVVLKREVAYKDYEINVLKSEFEKVKQEKEGVKFKIEKFDKASKDLDKLLESQITDKKPEFKGYGTENSEQESNVVSDKKSDDPKENSDESLVEEQVSKDTSSFVESSLNVDKKTIFLVDKKVEFSKPKNHEKPVKKSVRDAEMYRSQTPRGNQRNWNGQKSNQLGRDFVMYNKACFIKIIKREYSVARTPQQNGVAERRNRTLIEAARTILGKFDGKSDEGFFVGYSLSSKAFRNGPKWLFDIDSLTQSMIYVPVATGTIINEFVGTQGELNVGTSEEISQDYIVMLIWKDASYFDSLSNDVDIGEPKSAADDQKQVEDGLDNENDEKDKSDDDSSPKEVNAAGKQVNTASADVNTGSFKVNVVSPSVNTASSYDQDSPKDMFTMGASHTLEALMLIVSSHGRLLMSLYSQSIDGRICYIQSVLNESKTSRHVKRGRDTKIPQSSGPPVKVGDEAVHKELGDRMERAATTASSLEAEQDSGSGPRCQDTILGDVDAQTRFEITSKLVHDSHLSQEIQALIDNKKIIITESSIQSDLHLGDAGGTDCLLTATIFEELEHMGLSAKTAAWNEFSSAMASAIICLATNQKFNFSKYIFDAMLGDMSHHKKIYVNPSHIKKIFARMKREGNDFSRRVTPLFATMMVQPNQEEGVDSGIPTDSHQTPITTQPSSSRSQKQSRRKQRKDTAVTQEEPHQDDSVPTLSNDPPISGEDNMQLSELMILCTNLQKQVLDLEKTKDAQAKEIADLKKRVQKLERKKKSRTTGLKRLRKVGMSRRVKSSKDKDSLGGLDDAEMFDINELHGDEIVVDMPVGEKQEQSAKEREVNTRVEVSAAPTTIEEITLAQTLIQIKSAKPKVVTTATTTTTTTRPKARGFPTEKKKIKLPDEIWQEIFQATVEAELILRRKDCKETRRRSQHSFD
ncbi:ribonuclease H-like domain-containing protein [Tanacetum coccineum]